MPASSPPPSRPLRLLSVLALLALWQAGAAVAAARGQGALFPGPLTVATEGWSLLATGALGRHAAASLARVLAGLALGTVAGVSLGHLMAAKPWARDLVEPAVAVLRPVPPLAWLPLVVVWLGIGLRGQAAVVFLGCVFPVMLATYEGARSVEQRYVEAARVLGADGWTTWRRVVAPASLPAVLTGVRVGAGVAWMCVVAAELGGVRSGLGLGAIMLAAQDISRADRIIVGMASVGLLGWATDRLLVWLEGRLAPWR